MMQVTWLCAGDLMLLAIVAVQQSQQVTRFTEGLSQ